MRADRASRARGGLPATGGAGRRLTAPVGRAYNRDMPRTFALLAALCAPAVLGAAGTRPPAAVSTASAATGTATAATSTAPAATGDAPIAVEDAREVSLLELANVEWTRGKKLPKEVRELKGKQVKLVGYMALDTEEGQRSFRMSYESCSCSTAKVTHFVKVTLPEGEETKFEPGLIEVVGKFYPGAKYDDDGFVDSVYRVSAKSITVQ